MASLNKAMIIGNLGKDPDVRTTSGGQTVCELSIATNESYTDKNGQQQDRTEWHRIIVWGRQAELCGEYLKKGRSVFVEGKIQTRKWQDKDGNNRYTTEIVANQVTFLDSGNRGQRPPPPGDEDAPAARQGGGGRRDADTPGFKDDDIPF